MARENPPNNDRGEVNDRRELSCQNRRRGRESVGDTEHAERDKKNVNQEAGEGWWRVTDEGYRGTVARLCPLGGLSEILVALPITDPSRGGLR